MRILQLCLRSPYPPRDGGAIAMDRLARSLVNSNVKVDVLAFNTLKHNIDPASIPEEYRVVFNPQFVEARCIVEHLGCYSESDQRKILQCIAV
jgi:polysaccharide biosynthesis protein PslH